ncbi:type III-A CRISPR-associated protein Cas10/Csm1 [Brachyspira intermedia]|uniref:type III-A CRISPR-associated protein Cas10/Csm1 n=1 Tax=Brachyspira intermedia TaxID=84377 RepID=UPI0030043C07
MYNYKIYNSFLLKSIFYDLDNIILYFSSETEIQNYSEIREKLSELKNLLEYNDELIDKVSLKLNNIILEKNGFEFIDNDNKIVNDNKELLKSIFTTFKKHNKEEKRIKIEDINYYPLTTLENEKIIYPDKNNNTSKKDFVSEYKDKIVDLINRILDVIKKINKNKDDKLIELENINYILNILSNIFSYIPYSYQNKDCIGDISFYDKLKINTALSSCLYLLKERNELEKSSLNDDFSNHFVLLSGDISGIQKFIYTISSKGALKSLRARSFYLEIMLEHIADEILEYFHLTRANLLYTGGGHFYIILPNYKEFEKDGKKYESIKRQIDEIMYKLNDWFIDNFSIDLYIAMGIQEFNFDDLRSYLKEKNIKKGFSDVFKKLSIKLTEIKQRRYIYENNKEQLRKLLEPKDNTAEFECDICHTSSKYTYKRYDLDGEVYACNICYNLYKTGKYMLSKEESIFVLDSTDSLDNNENIKIIDLPSIYKESKRYLYFGESDKINGSDLVRAYSKNNKESKYVNLFLGDYNFKKDKESKDLIDFETLVKCEEIRGNKAYGINRLAVLRCDVDSLGDAFINGFWGHADILRTSAFSRHLSLFFKYYINFVCEGKVSFPNSKLFEDEKDENKYYNKEKRAVIVYSGGDDVFLVGQWLDVINLTLDLKEAFQKYTNDRLTFSAGIGFFHIKYPISKMASQTGELEDLAKKNESGKKNSVALFGIPYNDKEKFEYVFNWEEFDNVREKIEVLFKNCYFSKDDYYENKVFLSSSMMYRLKQLIELSSKDKAINIARLAYSLARISHNDGNNECYNEFKDNIYNWFTSENRKDIKYLNTALDFIIYLFRKE